MATKTVVVAKGEKLIAKMSPVRPSKKCGELAGLWAAAPRLSLRAAEAFEWDLEDARNRLGRLRIKRTDPR